MKDPTLELVEVMFQISRLMKQQMSFTTDLLSLSALQVQTLVFLSQHEEVTMSDIAQYFGIELPSSTSLLNKLVNLKLAQRTADSKDRRLVRLALTEAGKNLLDQATRARKKKLKKFLSYLSPKEKTDMLAILSTLRTRLQK